MKTNWLFGVTLLMSLYATSAAQGASRLQNAQLRLSFDPKTGALTEFQSKASAHEFLAPTTNAYLWQLRWRDVAGNKNGLIDAAAAQSFKFEQTSATSARLLWQQIGLAGAPDLEVEAHVALPKDDAASHWNIRLRHTGSLRFEEVRFPCVQSIARQTNEFLAAPVWIGQLAANPRDLLNKNGQAHDLRYEYPGLASMQLLAFYQKNGPGLSMSCDDTNAIHKTFLFSGDGKGAVNFALLQLPETSANSSSGDYTQSYDAVLSAFQGDWFTAAESYRSWATNQWWAHEARLLRPEKSWARDTGLWVWNRGRSDGVLQPAIALQKKLGLPVSVMWHWWHGCAYDIGFPEYLPPREGGLVFSNALAKAHQKDVHAIVYMNQRLWGMTTKSWVERDAADFAVRASDGKIHPEVYNTFTKSPCASMCMGTSFWRNHYAGLTSGAFTLGVDGIYMDQACSSLACYNPEHGHPLGGGDYWMNGFRQMSEDIRARAGRLDSRKTIALAGEGVGESWLPYLDLMLSLQVSKERYSGPDGWEPIPFFQAVYHPFEIQYGNYSSLTMPPYDDLWPKEFAPKEPLKLLDQKFSQQFYLEQARAFVWGQQPTIANFQTSQLKDRPQEISYVLELARIRHRTLDYLQRGTFLRAPDIHVPEKSIDMSRLSIYAGQQGGLTTFQKTVPMVLASAWRGEHGNVAIVLASISNEPQSLLLPLDNASYGLPNRGVVYRVGEKGRQKLQRFSGAAIQLAVTLQPREACVLEFVP